MTSDFFIQSIEKYYGKIMPPEKIGYIKKYIEIFKDVELDILLQELLENFDDTFGKTPGIFSIKKITEQYNKYAEENMKPKIGVKKVQSDFTKQQIEYKKDEQLSDEERKTMIDMFDILNKKLKFKD